MNWKNTLRSNFTSAKMVSDFLQLDDAQRDMIDLDPSFSLLLPRRLAQKIEKGTLQDPIFAQFVPLKKERTRAKNFSFDPLQESHFQKSEKLLQKYEGRALILTTGACAMHCRFCFRSHFHYDTKGHTFEKEIATLKKSPSIEEVILSGGDPLALPNEKLFALIDQIASIDHIKRIRLHSRFPIGIPERVDADFLAGLAACKKQLIFVLHTNHAREFDSDVWQALAEIQKFQIPILSQSVLLKGVNDQKEALYCLFSTLANHGIIPYYLHRLDQVQQAAHFQVSPQKGKKIIQSLRKCLSGYCVPRFVEEIPNQPSKAIIL